MRSPSLILDLGPCFQTATLSMCSCIQTSTSFGRFTSCISGLENFDSACVNVDDSDYLKHVYEETTGYEKGMSSDGHVRPEYCGDRTALAQRGARAFSRRDEAPLRQCLAPDPEFWYFLHFLVGSLSLFQSFQYFPFLPSAKFPAT